MYKNDTSPFTNVSIYEGFDSFYNESLEIDLSGFLTPETGDINASFHVLSGESDNGYQDRVTIEDKDGDAHQLINPANDINNDDFLNATIARYGVFDTNRLPNFENALGIDIDSVYIEYNDDGVIKPILENNQTSTKLKFTSFGDQLFIPMVSFTTEIYQPDLCYDYAYSQNNRFFTEENNGSLNLTPKIVGDVNPGDPVQVRIQLKNLEEDSIASNIVMYVKNINSTNEATYDGNLSVTEPNGLTYKSLTPNSFSNNHVTYLTASALSNQQSVYSQFDIMPTKNSLDIPLDMSIDFSILLSNDVSIDYSGFNLKNEVPLCTTANFDYAPQWGIFNVEDSALRQDQDDNNADRKYNLFTQVAGRPFSLDVTTYEPSGDYNQIKTDIQTIVAVDLIDAKPFHDVNISCDDPSALTPRIWVPIYSETPATTIDFAQAIVDGDISDTDDFFAVARENIAVRVSYTVSNDGDESLIDWNIQESGDNIGKVLINNYDKLVKVYGPNCTNPLSTDLLVEDICGETGDAGLTIAQFKQCQECLFGANVRRVCSRDNFSIRPEGFFVKISDNNQSIINANPKNEVPEQGNLAAGYKYRYDINATTHTDESGIEGYTLQFKGGLTPDSDHNATYFWKPNGS